MPGDDDAGDPAESTTSVSARAVPTTFRELLMMQSDPVPSTTSAPARAGPCSFKELLKQLEQAHIRDLSLLWEENAKLREKLSNATERYTESYTTMAESYAMESRFWSEMRSVGSGDDLSRLETADSGAFMMPVVKSISKPPDNLIRQVHEDATARRKLRCLTSAKVQEACSSLRKDRRCQSVGDSKKGTNAEQNNALAAQQLGVVANGQQHAGHLGDGGLLRNGLYNTETVRSLPPTRRAPSDDSIGNPPNKWRREISPDKIQSGDNRREARAASKGSTGMMGIRAPGQQLWKERRPSASHLPLCIPGDSPSQLRGADSPGSLRTMDIAKAKLKPLKTSVSENSVGSDGTKARADVFVDEDAMNVKGRAVLNLFGEKSSKVIFRFWANYTGLQTRHVTFNALPLWSNAKDSETRAIPLSPRLPRKRRNPNEWEHGEPDTGFDSVETALSGRTLHRVGSNRCMISPGSSGRITWDIVGAVLLAFDVVMIPMSAFMKERDSFTIFMDWATLFFWTVDIVASCLTGFMDDKGILVMDPKLVFYHYLKTWFLIDLLVCGPDWTCTVIELTSDNTTGTSGNSGKLLRAVRVVRMSRMIRLVKLKRIMVMVRDRIDSENLFIIGNICRLIVVIVVMNHFLASMWYAIGDVGNSFSGPNWIESHGFSGKPLADRYFVSFHWSLTQFSPASMDVQPHNVGERIFAITVLIFGLVLFSSFISSITASMTQLRWGEGDKSKQFWLLRRYLRQHSIGAGLSWRVLRYVEFATVERKNQVHESKIWVLQLLSSQLRNELNCSVSFSVVKLHPLMGCANRLSRTLMIRLSEKAMSIVPLAANDLLVPCGVLVCSMFMVVSGKLAYMSAAKVADMDIEEDYGKYEMFLSHKDVACEACLWTDWHTLGELYAHTECKLVAIDAAGFAQVVQKDYAVMKFMCQYAQKFCNYLSERKRKNLTDICEASEFPRLRSWCYLKRLDSARSGQSGKSSGFSVLSHTPKLTFHGFLQRAKSRVEQLASTSTRQHNQVAPEEVGFSHIA